MIGSFVFPVSGVLVRSPAISPSPTGSGSAVLVPDVIAIDGHQLFAALRRLIILRELVVTPSFSRVRFEDTLRLQSSFFGAAFGPSLGRLGLLFRSFWSLGISAFADIFLIAAFKPVVVFVEQAALGDVSRVAAVLVDVNLVATFRRRRRLLTVAGATFLRFGRSVLALLRGFRVVRFREKSLLAALAAVFVGFFGSSAFAFDFIVVLLSGAFVLAIALEGSTSAFVTALVTVSYSLS